MAKKLYMTTADYLVIAVSPALIMALVGSLVYFLIDVFYAGQYEARLDYAFGLFVFAAVLIARISIEEGREYAALFALPLGLAMFLVLLKFMEHATPFSHLINLLLMVEVIAFGEAIALAEKGGVTRETAVDAVLKSVAASPVLGYRGPFILEGKMPAVPLADVTLQQKDMILALDLGRKLGSPVPLAAAANEMMNACRGLGIDHRDFVTAHEVYRRLGGQS